MTLKPRAPGERSPAGPAAPGRPAGRCLLLTRAGAAVPGSLLEGLRARGLGIETFADGMALIGALAAGSVTAVIIHEPARRNDLDELLIVVQRYYPGTSIWEYEPAGAGLRPMQTGKGGMGSGRKSDDAGQAGNGAGGTAGTLSKPAWPEPGTAGGGDSLESESSELLTQEELDMLLGPAEDQPAASGGADTNAADLAVAAALARADSASEPDGQNARPTAGSLQAPASELTGQQETEELGDVDLVEQVLARRQNLHELAVELVRQRSGLTDIALARDAAAVPTGHLAAPVAFEGRQFGLLHVPPPADGIDLTAWAQWLSRWMALGQRMDELWHLALRDELTGAWNRRYFMRFLTAILDRAARQRFRVTVMVFDIDDFKQYNDRYGHAAGDEILRETARLMNSVVRAHDVVARIGGDEFAVIFWDARGPRRPNSQHPHDVRKAAERFQKAICTHRFPKLLDDAPGTLTISGGLAGFPWDGRTPLDLLEQADAMARHSKQQGKNALTFGQGCTQGGTDATA